MASILFSIMRRCAFSILVLRSSTETGTTLSTRDFSSSSGPFDLFASLTFVEQASMPARIVTAPTPVETRTKSLLFIFMVFYFKEFECMKIEFYFLKDVIYSVAIPYLGAFQIVAILFGTFFGLTVQTL